MMFVSLEQANMHLRRDSSDDDADVTLKIAAASAVIASYLASHGSPYEPMMDSGLIVIDSNGDQIPALDSNGDAIVKVEVQQATLLLLGEFYKSREGDHTGKVDAQFGFGHLPQAVMALLYPLRDPVFS